MGVYFEFIGGCRDREEYSTNSADDLNRRRAEHLWRITKEGEVGSRVNAPTQYAIQEIERWKAVRAYESGALNSHCYEVVERIPEGDEVLVRLRFAGVEAFRDASRNQG